MKKVFIVMLLTMMGTGTLLAQQSINELNASVDINEVPAVVLQAFEKEFGYLPEKGIWKVYYVIADEGPLPTIPFRYYYQHHTKNGWVRASFSPDGDIQYTKGLARKPSVKDPS